MKRLNGSILVLMLALPLAALATGRDWANSDMSVTINHQSATA